jgi:pimeloyl-ACP methyl ester carboxylesterase
VAEIAQSLSDVMLEDPKTQTSTRLGDVRDEAALRFTASCLKQLDPEVLDPIVAGEWLDGFDIQDVMQRVKCPVLLLQAEVAAGGMLTDEDADSLKLWTSDFVHVRFPGCDHSIHWSRTEELLSAVHAFLGALDL